MLEDKEYDDIVYCIRNDIDLLSVNWEAKNSLGWSVAHEAARLGKLPVVHFNNWGIVTPDGWTVAHEAAKVGILPPSFGQWNLVDSLGNTVRDIAVKYGYLTIDVN